MNVVAIIPARSGSKRIINKNIVTFNDKPLIYWTIEAAKQSGIFKDIWVSTDSEVIANICSGYGARVIIREENNDDISTVSEATIAAIKQLKRKEYSYDIVVQLMATCPLRTKEDIVDAYNNFIESKRNFQISCFKYGWMNPWWAVRINERVEALFPEALKTRSQDLPTLYCPTGAIWIANIRSLLIEKTFYGFDLGMFPINWKTAVDIDDLDDLKFAAVLKNMEINEKPKNTIKQTARLLESIKQLEAKVKKDKKDIRDLEAEEINKNLFHTIQKKTGPDLDDETRHLQKIRNRERAMKRTKIMLDRVMWYMKTLKDDDDYIILDLKYLKGLTIKEIAKKLECSTRTIERRQHNILQKMKVLLFGSDALGG